jgi:hypothetical protein
MIANEYFRRQKYNCCLNKKYSSNCCLGNNLGVSTKQKEKREKHGLQQISKTTDAKQEYGYLQGNSNYKKLGQTVNHKHSG